MSSIEKSETTTLPGAGDQLGRRLADGDAAGSRPQPGEGRLRAWLQYPIYIAIALFAVLKDPLHWEEASTNLSQDIFYRVFIGPFYPTDHRDDITVVLFNEATLRDLGATWPVPLGTHAEILETIRAMGPRAVMVDFIFPDERVDPSLPILRDQIEAYEAAGVPLYFGRAEGTAIGWIRSDLADVATLTSIANPISDGVSRTYDPCSLIGIDHASCACVAAHNEFEACPPGVDAASDDSPVALTAAFQMYRSYTNGLPQAFSVHDPVAMDVVWSNRLNPVNDEWMRKTTDLGLEELCLKIGPDVPDVLRRAFSKAEDRSLHQTCPYATTVPAHALLRAVEDRTLFNALWVHLQSKFVFYGADLAGLEDTVVPPTHVKLPGVYLHAMALDNLLTFGGEYKRSSLTRDGRAIDPKYVGAAVAVLLAIIVVAFARSNAVQRAKHLPVGGAQGFAYLAVVVRRQIPWTIFNAVMLVLISVICLTLYFGFELSPKNWVGYWALLTFLSVQGPWIEGMAKGFGEHFWPSSRKFIFTE